MSGGALLGSSRGRFRVCGCSFARSPYNDARAKFNLLCLLCPAALVLSARSEWRLARAGLSAPKIRTLKAIAKAIDRGELDLPALVEKPADEAHAALTVVHGIVDMRSTSE